MLTIMMSMTNRLMLDSSVLVEYVKERRTELLDRLLVTPNLKLYINSTVLSEYTFHWLATQGGKSPRTLQQAEQVKQLVTDTVPIKFLKLFTVLPSNDRIVPIYLDLMQHYNLLPNDALIIATAKLHGISAIASHDADFIDACRGEGIQLVCEVADLT